MMTFILAAGAALAVVPTSSHHTLSTVVVDYADLDLASPEGQRQLDRRISVASSKACRRPQDRSTREMADYRRCRYVAKRAVGERVQLAIAKRLANRDRLAAAR